jgi:hypothetical protein
MFAFVSKETDDRHKEDSTTLFKSPQVESMRKSIMVKKSNYSTEEILLDIIHGRR